MTINKIPVIYYHSVALAKHPTWSRRFLTLETKYFELQLRYFRSKGYRSVFLDEWYAITSNKHSTTEKLICLTFDDGFLDNFVFVLPLLKKYGFKATLFINPEFIDEKQEIRPTLSEYWDNKIELNKLKIWGYLSWPELNIMQESGLFDIQSHTLTHTKYFVNDNLVGFHHPGCDCLYPVGNLYPHRKPYYIDDPSFEKLIPYGYPFFEEKSAVIARKVIINPDFIDEVVFVLKNKINSRSYSFEDSYNYVKNIYYGYKNNRKIIISREDENGYKKRLEKEIIESKARIEENLNKRVDFLCWPHGDNSAYAHDLAINVGYKASTLGKMTIANLDHTRIERFGLPSSKNSVFLTALKTRYKINGFLHKNPYYLLKKVYEFFRDYGR